MTRDGRRTVLFRRPVSGRDFVVVGVLLVLGAVVGSVLAALRRDDVAAHLAQTLPLTLATVVPTAVVVLGGLRLASRPRADRPPRRPGPGADERGQE